MVEEVKSEESWVSLERGLGSRVILLVKNITNKSSFYVDKLYFTMTVKKTN